MRGLGLVLLALGLETVGLVNITENRPWYGYNSVLYSLTVRCIARGGDGPP